MLTPEQEKRLAERRAFWGMRHRTPKPPCLIPIRWCACCHQELEGNERTYCVVCSEIIKLLRKQVSTVMRQYRIPVADGQVCADCGKRAFCYDHRYYSRPLDLEPVCRTCNIRRGPALDTLGALVPFESA